jgi:hypothetical protein
MPILEAAVFLQVVFADDRFVAGRLLLIVSVHYFACVAGEKRSWAPQKV